MDSSASTIRFDAEGVCNFCSDFSERLVARDRSQPVGMAGLARLVASVKASGRGRDYDCIVGVSGGVDSSYVLYLAVKNGLRPLAVHLDNGWNSELAAHNITSLVTTLGVDLYTHVIDWDEYRDLQISFFRAHVVDIELLMDNAMLALNYQQAARHGVKYILSGANLATEGLEMPWGWFHYKRDARNIRAIHRRFGSRPIKTQPMLSTISHAWCELVRGIHWASVLDLCDYQKTVALDVLTREVGYRPYPYKHYESVFTRFYQAHILPKKFGYDKRRVHLSALITTGQMTRDEALALLKTPAYPDPRQEHQDRVYVMKKLGFSESEFEEYLAAPSVGHERYGSELPLHRALARVRRLIGVR